MKINIVLKLEMTSHEENLFYEQFKKDCEQKKKEKINVDMEDDYIPEYLLCIITQQLAPDFNGPQQEFYVMIERIKPADLFKSWLEHIKHVIDKIMV